jgi:SOS-response transcriptional repressor LexA
VLMTHDALEPIIRSGQYALVDGTGMPPQDSDLVVIHAQDGSNYARRYWSDSAGIYLVGLNDVRPVRPVTLTQGIHHAARVLGVLFDGPTSLTVRSPGAEWVAVTDDPNKLMKDTFGVRVTGASMDPIAKDGDIVLVRSVTPASIRTGSLACVDIDEMGVVLKRCYRSGSTWILCPIGPASAEEPIITSSDRILHVFQLSGVLFASAMTVVETLAGSTPPRAA